MIHLSNLVLSKDGTVLVAILRCTDTRVVKTAYRTVERRKETIGHRLMIKRSLGNVWVTERFLSLPDSQGEYTLAISEEGSDIVVGDPMTSIAGVSESGAVYHYRYRESDWKFTGLLEPDSRLPYNHFGTSLSLSEVDKLLIVGAPGSLKVHTFELSEESWVQQSTIMGDPDKPTQRFGHSVAVAKNASYLAVGAPSSLADQSTVYVYQRQSLDWIPYRVHQGPQTTDARHFGWSVGIDDHYHRLVIGTFSDKPTFNRMYYYTTEQDRMTWVDFKLRSNHMRRGMSVFIDRRGRCLLIGSSCLGFYLLDTLTLELRKKISYFHGVYALALSSSGAAVAACPMYAGSINRRILIYQPQQDQWTITHRLEDF